MIFAQSSSGSGSGLSLLLPIVLLVGLYLLLVRPQRARMRQMTAVQRSLHPGARVVTTAGLHATVSEVDGDTVLLEIAPGVVARFASQAVVRTLPDETAQEPDGAPDGEPATPAGGSVPLARGRVADDAPAPERPTGQDDDPAGDARR